ncbi:hypothetical protein J6590_051879 [Homalodisca vitripennis]|nr:hypothetical protein J6590_051879 [Homalodisca vitripennis]
MSRTASSLRPTIIEMRAVLFSRVAVTSKQSQAVAVAVLYCTLWEERANTAKHSSTSRQLSQLTVWPLSATDSCMLLWLLFYIHSHFRLSLSILLDPIVLDTYSTDDVSCCALLYTVGREGKHRQTQQHKLSLSILLDPIVLDTYSTDDVSCCALLYTVGREGKHRQTQQHK